MEMGKIIRYFSLSVAMILTCLFWQVAMVKADVYQRKCGTDAYWEINTDTGTLIVSRTGRMDD